MINKEKELCRNKSTNPVNAIIHAAVTEIAKPVWNTTAKTARAQTAAKTAKRRNQITNNK